MHGLQAGEQLRRDLAGLAQLERSPLLRDLEQGGAVDVLHGYQLETINLDEIEDAADIWRHHLARCPDLAPNQLQRAFVTEQVGAKGLQRHLHTQSEIKGLPHLTHAAPAEQPAHLVATRQRRPRHQHAFSDPLGRQAGGWGRPVFNAVFLIVHRSYSRSAPPLNSTFNVPAEPEPGTPVGSVTLPPFARPGWKPCSEAVDRTTGDQNITTTFFVASRPGHCSRLVVARSETQLVHDLQSRYSEPIESSRYSPRNGDPHRGADTPRG